MNKLLFTVKLLLGGLAISLRKQYSNGRASAAVELVKLYCCASSSQTVCCT